MNTSGVQPKHSRIRTVAVVLASVFVVGFVFRMTEAGSLTPSSAPAATLRTLEEIFNPLAGTYDSSSVPGIKNGDIMNEVKCLIGKMKGFGGCNYTFAKAPTVICAGSPAVDLDAGGNGSIGWTDAVINWQQAGVPISEYQIGLDVPSPYATSSFTSVAYPVTCSDMPTQLIRGWACNGSACDYCLTAVTINDPFAVCPP
jgi:hypothetical protein